MPVPWEAAIPFGIIAGAFAFGQVAWAEWAKWTNDGLPPRYAIDEWDERMLERDRRLTGHTRRQRDEVKAPPEFATNSIWIRYWNPNVTPGNWSKHLSN